METVTDEVYSIDEIKRRLSSVFESEPVYKAVLFGSYAKGEATESSDVDIMIDSRGLLLNMNFYGVLHDITECLGKKVDLIEVTEIREDSPLYTEVHERGIMLYER